MTAVVKKLRVWILETLVKTDQCGGFTPLLTQHPFVHFWGRPSRVQIQLQCHSQMVLGLFYLLQLIQHLSQTIVCFCRPIVNGNGLTPVLFSR